MLVGPEGRKQLRLTFRNSRSALEKDSGLIISARVVKAGGISRKNGFRRRTDIIAGTNGSQTHGRTCYNTSGDAGDFYTVLDPLGRTFCDEGLNQLLQKYMWGSQRAGCHLPRLFS